MAEREFSGDYILGQWPMVARPGSVPGVQEPGKWPAPPPTVPPPAPRQLLWHPETLMLAEYLAPLHLQLQLPQLNTCPAGHAGSREGGTTVARDAQRESLLPESGDRAAGRRKSIRCWQQFYERGSPERCCSGRCLGSRQVLVEKREAR